MSSKPPNATSPSWHGFSRNELLREIQRSVDLEIVPVHLGGQLFQWYRVANPEGLLEQAAAAEDARHAEDLDPFWAATWRAALGLDRFLGRLPLAGRRVLELGCGSGQAGTGAAARGGMVTMTDTVELALQVAKLNAWPVAHRVRVRLLNWQRQRLTEEAFPIIVGSDLVYDPALFPRLEACARQHLAAGGKLYLSEPHRHTGDRFADWIRQAGWDCREHDVDLEDQRVAVRVFECWRPQNSA